MMEIQFHSDENDNTTQEFRHATRLLKGVWIHFTPGSLSLVIIIIIIIRIIRIIIRSFAKRSRYLL